MVRNPASTAGRMHSIPGQGTKIGHAVQHGRKKRDQFPRDHRVTKLVSGSTSVFSSLKWA